MNNLQPLVWIEISKKVRNDPSICELDKGALWIADDNLIFRYNIKNNPNSKELPFIVNYGGRQPKEVDSVEYGKHWAEHTHYASQMQPYVKPDSISSYFDRFTQWGLDRGIIQNGNELAQGLKLVSEMGELADNLAKGRCIKDDIGDCMVVLNMLANMTGVKVEDCLAQAWGDIKDRKGYMNEHGVFIKDSDVG